MPRACAGGGGGSGSSSYSSIPFSAASVGVLPLYSSFSTTDSVDSALSVCLSVC